MTAGLPTSHCVSLRRYPRGVRRYVSPSPSDTPDVELQHALDEVDVAPVHEPFVHADVEHELARAAARGCELRAQLVDAGLEPERLTSAVGAERRDEPQAVGGGDPDLEDGLLDRLGHLERRLERQRLVEQQRVRSAGRPRHRAAATLRNCASPVPMRGASVGDLDRRRRAAPGSTALQIAGRDLRDRALGARPRRAR